MSIFWNIDSYLSVIEKPLGILTSGTVNCGNGVYLLKAGTPISNVGAVANTGDAKYLVAEDFYFYSNTPTQPKLVKLIETGYVDINAAEAAAGITYADAAKTALATAGIVLVDGALETGGSDSSNVLVAHATVMEMPEPGGEPVAIELDKPLAELAVAENSVVEVGMEVEGVRNSYVLPLAFRQGSAALGYIANIEGSVFIVTGTSAGFTFEVYEEAGDEPFVLHGTITSQETMSGTVQESAADLAAAIEADKRVIFKVTMPTQSGSMAVSVSCNALTVENGSPAAYGTGSIDASVLLAVYVRKNNGVLAFQAWQYAITPFSGS
ncbi:MAG: hypothetical protein II965_05760 [Pyramidobacter sp.]|nr:hypothetical protein [Pyramidobacter sp.]